MPKKGDWRAKREEFVATLRAARRDARMIKKGVKFHSKVQRKVSM